MCGVHAQNKLCHTIVQRSPSSFPHTTLEFIRNEPRDFPVAVCCCCRKASQHKRLAIASHRGKSVVARLVICYTVIQSLAKLKLRSVDGVCVCAYILHTFGARVMIASCTRRWESRVIFN